MGPGLRLRTCKELAEDLRRNVNYVYAMRRHGFHMIGNRATLGEALEWLDRHPEFRKNRQPESRRADVA